MKIAITLLPFDSNIPLHIPTEKTTRTAQLLFEWFVDNYPFLQNEAKNKRRLLETVGLYMSGKSYFLPQRSLRKTPVRSTLSLQMLVILPRS